MTRAELHDCVKLLIGLLLFAALCTFFYNWPFGGGGDGCPPGRMPSSCLSWASVDRYERQFRGDVPIGASWQDVTGYLEREQIAFRVDTDGYPPNTRLIRVEKKLMPGLWQDRLFVTLAFDGNDRLGEISFHRRMIVP